MDKLRDQSLGILRAYLLLMLVFGLLALMRVAQVMKMFGIVTFQWKWMSILAVIGCVTLLMSIFFLFTWNEKIRYRFTDILARIPLFRSLKIISSVLFVLLISFNTWLFTFSPAKGIFSGYGTITMVWSGGSNYYVDQAAVHPVITLQEFVGNNLLSFQSGYFQWWMFGILGLAAAIILKIGWKKVSISLAILGGVIGEAVLYKIISFMPSISTYPFALTWEESHRSYAASLVAAERIYGITVPLPISDFSLNIINGIPFLLGNPTILVYRLWISLLWVGSSAFVCFLLVRRLKIENRLIAWLFSGWTFLFLLMEGGIKYNLLFCVAIILVSFSIKHPWRSLISIIFASIWAGLSRVNWYPVPAMLAIALFLLEEPVKNYRNWAKYLLKPGIYGGIGLGVAVVSNSAVSWIISRSPGSFGGEQLKSALLWYRLLPNATYPLGILPAVILVSLPLLLICLLRSKGLWSFIRVASLITLSTVLFFGGLAVSVNIGGGSDLHNMDAFLIMLLIITSYILFNRFSVDKPMDRKNPIGWIIALSLLISRLVFLPYNSLLNTYDATSTDQAIQTLRRIVIRQLKMETCYLCTNVH